MDLTSLTSPDRGPYARPGHLHKKKRTDNQSKIWQDVIAARPRSPPTDLLDRQWWRAARRHAGPVLTEGAVARRG